MSTARDYDRIDRVPRVRVSVIEFIEDALVESGLEEGLETLRGYGAAEVVQTFWATNSEEEAFKILRRRALAARAGDANDG